MQEEYVEVEFDPAFRGEGVHTGSVNRARIPVSLIREMGRNRAFLKTTGMAETTIVRWIDPAPAVHPPAPAPPAPAQAKPAAPATPAKPAEVAGAATSAGEAKPDPPKAA